MNKVRSKTGSKNSVFAFLKCMDGSILAFLKCMDKSVLVSLKYMAGLVLAHLRFSIQSAPTRFSRTGNSGKPKLYARIAPKCPIWNRMYLISNNFSQSVWIWRIWIFNSPYSASNRKSRIRAKLGPLVDVWFRSTDSIPWV